MKRIFIFLVFSAFVLQGCTDNPNPKYDTPEKTIAALADAIWSNDYARYLDTMSRDMRDKSSLKTYSRFISSWSGKYKILKTLESDGNDKVALLLKSYYDCESPDTTGRSGYWIIRADFVLENGEWKIEGLNEVPNEASGE